MAAKTPAKGAKKRSPKPLRQKDNRLRTAPSKRAAQIFADEFANTPNRRGAITRAAQKAYPNQKPEAARVSGSRLLRHPNVRAMIQSRLDRAAESANITRQQIVGLLAQAANSSIGDIADLLDGDGNLNWEQARARGVDHLIRQIEVTERHSTIGNLHRRRVTTKVKIVDNLKASDLLADILGLKKQAMKNPVDSARESYEIMRRKQDYADVPDQELARLAQEAHGLPPSMIPDIMVGVTKR